MRSLKIAGLVLGAFLVIALPASAAARFRGGFVVGPAFSPWGLYAPYGYGPYGLYEPYPAYNANAGELKLKTMWLRPDAYNIEIRAAGYTSYAERIYLLAGKSWQVKADLLPVPKS